MPKWVVTKANQIHEGDMAMRDGRAAYAGPINAMVYDTEVVESESMRIADDGSLQFGWYGLAHWCSRETTFFPNRCFAKGVWREVK
jgi:hypothetical protein